MWDAIKIISAGTIFVILLGSLVILSGKQLARLKTEANRKQAALEWIDRNCAAKREALGTRTVLYLCGNKWMTLEEIMNDRRPY